MRVMRSLPTRVPNPKSSKLASDDATDYPDPSPDTTGSAGRHALRHGKMAEDMGAHTNDGPVDEADGELDDEPMTDDEAQEERDGLHDDEGAEGEVEESDSPQHEAMESDTEEAMEHDAHPGSPAARRPEPAAAKPDTKARKHGFMKYIKEGRDKGADRMKGRAAVGAGKVSHRGRSAGDAAHALMSRKHAPLK